jgi:hypothetical protein
MEKLMKDALDAQPKLWLQPHSGTPFYLENDWEPFLSLNDISVSLSCIVRFTGHSGVNYTVAQHSVLTAVLVPVEHAREALLHDSVEAITNDIATPVKRMIGPVFREFEDRMYKRMARHYKLPEKMSDIVKLADSSAMMAEKRDFLPHPDLDWGDTGSAICDTRLIPKLSFWKDSYKGRKLFLEAYEIVAREDWKAWNKFSVDFLSNKL